MRDGIFTVDKPKGITSFTIIKRIRTLYGIKKVGHTGTLDPFAQGLMIILAGKATKLCTKFDDDKKEYIGWMCLGAQTNTADATGNVILKKDFSHVSSDYIKNTFSGFQGEIEQVPPMFSAVKKDGVPLYKYARKNIVVERKKRKVLISKCEVLDVQLPYIMFKTVCSKGTYIRTLCEDIARKLGTVGHLVSLLRTSSGQFSLKDAVPFAQLNDYQRIESVFKDYADWGVRSEESAFVYQDNDRDPPSHKASADLRSLRRTS